MPRQLPTLMPADLELRLLRKGVGALEAHREGCDECGRTPLIGERVHHYGEAVVCQLCRGRRRREPDSTDLVRHTEHGHAVKLLAA